MYFAVMKITFEVGPDTANDAKEARSLAESLRKRFRVCAQPITADGIVAMAITALHHDENELQKKLEAVINQCETSGFGRVEFESTLLDHIDGLEDFEEDLSHE